MTQIVIHPTMQDQLRQVADVVDLCDAAGHVLGRFVPAGNAIGEPREPQIDEQEIVRREQSNAPRYSTAEVLDHLRRL